MRHAKLQCRIESLSYDFKNHTATLRLAPLNCVDMWGAINMCLAIDPAVARIVTYAGELQDTKYLRFDEDSWAAYFPAENAQPAIRSHQVIDLQD